MKIETKHRNAARKLAAGASQAAAATAAGVSRQAVAKWLRRPEFVALVETRAAPSAAAASESEQGTVEYLETQLDETHIDIEGARRMENYTAVSTLRKRAEECRKLLDAARPKAASLEDMDAAEYLDGMERAMRDWPDQFLELAGRVLGERYRDVH